MTVNTPTKARRVPKKVITRTKPGPKPIWPKRLAKATKRPGGWVTVGYFSTAASRTMAIYRLRQAITTKRYPNVAKGLWWFRAKPPKNLPPFKIQAKWSPTSTPTRRRSI